MAVLQGRQHLSELQLDMGARCLPGAADWASIFPESMPTIMVSGSTLKALKQKQYVIQRGSSIQLAGSKEMLSIQSWIFVSSYGRHGQAGSEAGGGQARQMLIDWTGAVAKDDSYIRIIAVRPEQKQVWISPRSFGY